MKFSIDMQDWKKAVKHVKQALSKNPIREVLRYAKYEIYDEKLRITALDDRVLNAFTISIQKENPSEFTEFINFVAPIPDIGKGKTLNVTIEENQILFATKNTTIIVPRIDIEFPSWKEIIPPDRDIPQFFMKVEVLKKAISGLSNDAIIGINIGDKDHLILLGNENAFSLVAPYGADESNKISLNP